MIWIKEQWVKAAPRLQEKFGYKNIWAVPRVMKVVVNVGLSGAIRGDAKLAESVESTLTRITGAKPVKTLARKSIANFKIRQGMVVGMKVTLRGRKMSDFLQRLLTVTFARVRDFRGITRKSVDAHGNLAIGFKEHIAFPEVRPDEVEKLHGLEIAVSSTAKTPEEGIALFEALGFPMKRE